ncbi:MAG: succinate dehydrogenase, cytochrome b556 subunit [Anaerolineales bacterium]|nr:succinate dehydrogenase, cytochrome b556 subunit [Anaerolineales bacterium]
MAHRLSGLAILGFLTIHVWDTANATFNPNVYSWSLSLFKHPFFGLGEIAVLGAVLYHSFNGLRITLLDFKPSWWMYQQKSAYIVWAVFLIIFVPIALYLTYGIFEHCGVLAAEGQSCWALPDWNAYMNDPMKGFEGITIK